MRIRAVLEKFDWKGWLGWMAATMAGVQLIVVVIFFSAAKLDNHWWDGLAMVSLAGTSLGVCQWTWLRRRLFKAWWWIVSTLLGWYLAAFLVMVFDMDLSDTTGALARIVAITKVLAITLTLSLPQWFWIRRQFRKAAWWWIVARPLAWLTGFGLIALSDWLKILPVSDLFSSTDYQIFVMLSTVAAIFGFGFAGVTGAAFTWIQTNQTVVRNHGD